MKKKYIIIFLLFIVVFIYSENSEADRIVEEGRQYLKIDQPNTTLEYMDKALSIDPNNINAHWYKALAYEALDKNDDEIKEYKIMLKIDPNNTKAREQLGLKKYHDKKYNEAIAIFDEILDIENTNSDAYYYKSLCRFFLKDYDLASKDMFDSIQYSKHGMTSSSFLIYCYLESKSNKKINIEKLVKEENHKPQTSWARLILDLFECNISEEDFFSLINTSKYDDAFYYRNKEELLRQKYYSAYFILGTFCLYKSNIPKSHLYFKKVINIESDNSGLYYLISKEEVSSDQDSYVKVLVENLRLRESQKTNSKIVSLLKKDEKLLLLDLGDYETIDNIQGQWIEVKTENGVIGWCYDGYCDYK